jgi:hypothetical protein
MKFQVNTNNIFEVKKALRDLWEKYVGPANCGDLLLKTNYHHFYFDSNNSYDPICHGNYVEPKSGEVVSLEQAIQKIVSYKKVKVLTLQDIVEAVVCVDKEKIVARYEELTGNTAKFNDEKDYYEVTINK